MSTFDTILNRLKTIAEIEGLSKDEVALLSSHKQVGYQKIKANGEEYEAWRIVHNRALGPGKGGIRFHPEVCEDEVKSLSFWMSLKNSLVGLPYGGGKGGIKFNPKEKNKKELEAISRAYIKAFYKVVGQDKDIPAPDVYTDGQIMSWMLDEYEKQVGHHEPGMITGKPIEMGGIALRADSTARGGFIVFSELMRATGQEKKSVTVSVQGYGNAGANMAMMLYKDGYTIVAVSDSKGGVFNANGLDLDKVNKVKKETGTVAEYAEGKKITNSELLEMQADVLVLAALENQITADNAPNVKAKYIVELANGPINPDADKILFSKNITVVPDILANAGGVMVSYFEWAMNRTGNILDEEYLRQKLDTMMKAAWEKVYGLSKNYKTKIDLRTAAYIIAIRRILAAEKYRGSL